QQCVPPARQRHSDRRLLLRRRDRARADVDLSAWVYKCVRGVSRAQLGGVTGDERRVTSKKRGARRAPVFPVTRHIMSRYTPLLRIPELPSCVSACCFPHCYSPASAFPSRHKSVSHSPSSISSAYSGSRSLRSRPPALRAALPFATPTWLRIAEGRISGRWISRRKVPGRCDSR